VRLGAATETGDAEGAVTERLPVDVDAPRLERALARFRGPIEQVPPMYSALKQAGQPLYALARAGQTVQRESRQVTVHELELVSREADLLRLRIRCSKGTYVRQIAVDLGLALGTVAHLAALRRTAVAGLRLDQAIALDDLQALGEASRLAWVLPPDRMIGHLPKIDLEAPLAARFANGQAVRCEGVPAGACRVYAEGALLGVGEGRPEGMLQPGRLIARG
jgi:tRNA pseudouridine55 synthase